MLYQWRVIYRLYLYILRLLMLLHIHIHCILHLFHQILQYLSVLISRYRNMLILKTFILKWIDELLYLLDSIFFFITLRMRIVLRLQTIWKRFINLFIVIRLFSIFIMTTSGWIIVDFRFRKLNTCTFNWNIFGSSVVIIISFLDWKCRLTFSFNIFFQWNLCCRWNKFCY